MNTFVHLLRKEFKQIFRNHTILKLIVGLPIIQLLIMPLAADYEIKNINIAIVDHDQSQFSRDLTRDILSSGYFRQTAKTQSYDEAFAQIEKSEADLLLEIPIDFEKNLDRNSAEDLFIGVDAINGMKANVGAIYVSRIISQFNSKIRSVGLNNTRLLNARSLIEVEPLFWYNPYLNYQLFMVPGILVILVTMVGAFMCALNIVKEKEVGTIEQINVTPIKKYQFIVGKLLPFWLIGIFVFTLALFLVARLVYGIIPVGSLLLLYSYLMIYLIAVLGVGLLISTYSNTQQQAMSLAFFVMMVFILMGGLFTPLASMPDWAKWLAYLNPVTYFIQVTRMIIMKGSGFSDIITHYYIMLAFAAFFNSWAILNYKKTQ